MNHPDNIGPNKCSWWSYAESFRSCESGGGTWSKPALTMAELIAINPNVNKELRDHSIAKQFTKETK